MVTVPETRSSLIARLADAKDSDAWQEFSELYEPFIYRQARRRGLSDEDSRELVQEVLLAISKTINRFEIDKSRGRFSTWLYAIGRNISLQRLSKLQRQPRSNAEVEIDQAVEKLTSGLDMPNRELTTQLRRHAFLYVASQVRCEFKENTWQAFWLTAVENVAVAEVAKNLSVSVGAVYISRSRVMARLRARVQEITLDEIPGSPDIPTMLSSEEETER